MSDGAATVPPVPKQIYYFSGHALGASARFTKLDNKEGFNEIVPVLGASVLPTTGGESTALVSNYCYEVVKPRRRNLLTVHRIATSAIGRDMGTHFETETNARVESITIVDKLHIDLLVVHVVSSRDLRDNEPKITSTGNKIQGVFLGAVEAKVTLNDDIMHACASTSQIARFFDGKSENDRNAASVVQQGGITRLTLVRDIQLKGAERDKQKITRVGNALYWDGFGFIFFGEVLVKDQDRQVNLVRLQMGSDDGGSGTMGNGQSNGVTGSN